MKHSQKMILVPEEKYQALQSQRKDTVEENLKDRSSSSLSPGIEEESKKEDSKKLPELDSTVIISAVPKPWQNKARSLLRHITADASTDIRWDHRGTVSVNGLPIPNSHITDLINDVVKPKKGFHPTGHKEFYDALLRMNVPLGLVWNSKRQQMTGGGETRVKLETKPVSKLHHHPVLPPPPGQPIKRKRKTIDWITF